MCSCPAASRSPSAAAAAAAALSEQVWASVRQLSQACQDQIQLGEQADLDPMLSAGIRLRHYVLDTAAASSSPSDSVTLSGALTAVERALRREAPAVQLQLQLHLQGNQSLLRLRYLRVSVATSFSNSFNPGAAAAAGTGTGTGIGRSG